jgi:hypothetical protein
MRLALAANSLALGTKIAAGPLIYFPGLLGLRHMGAQAGVPVPPAREAFARSFY